MLGHLKHEDISDDTLEMYCLEIYRMKTIVLNLESDCKDKWATEKNG
jgi:hypothetical protein